MKLDPTRTRLDHLASVRAGLLWERDHTACTAMGRALLTAWVGKVQGEIDAHKNRPDLPSPPAHLDRKDGRT